MPEFRGRPLRSGGVVATRADAPGIQVAELGITLRP
ncbi:hypothetical protein SUDANB106_04425 [Streptomyces sp. enrichment culture]